MSWRAEVDRKITEQQQAAERHFHVIQVAKGQHVAFLQTAIDPLLAALKSTPLEQWLTEIRDEEWGIGDITYKPQVIDLNTPPRASLSLSTYWEREYTVIVGSEGIPIYEENRYKSTRPQIEISTEWDFAGLPNADRDLIHNHHPHSPRPDNFWSDTTIARLQGLYRQVSQYIRDGQYQIVFQGSHGINDSVQLTSSLEPDLNRELYHFLLQDSFLRRTAGDIVGKKESLPKTPYADAVSTWKAETLRRQQEAEKAKQAQQSTQNAAQINRRQFWWRRIFTS